MQNKIAQYYLQKLAEFLLTLIVILLAIYLYGDSRKTDVLHTIVFLSLGIYLKEDKNLVTILLIVALMRLIPEIVNHKGLILNNPLIKTVLYIAACWGCYLLRRDKLAIFSLMLLLCMIMAEFYWWVIDYDKSPIIVFFVAYFINDLAVRYFVFARVYKFGKWSKGQKELPIDSQIYHLMGVLIWALAPLVIEYFFRHILNIQSLVIYSVYPEVVYFINVVILWIVLNYALKKTALFQA